MDLDLADDSQVFSLKKHIQGHVAVSILHLDVRQQELVLDAAHSQTCLALCLHEQTHSLCTNTHQILEHNIMPQYHASWPHMGCTGPARRDLQDIRGPGTND